MSIFLDNSARHARSRKFYEAIRQIDGCDIVSQAGESLGIHSRPATAIEDFRSGRQSSNELLSILFYKLVGVLTVVSIVLRPFVVCVFDILIIGVCVLHVGILATHGTSGKQK
jgi:hypothetical protein